MSPLLSEETSVVLDVTSAKTTSASVKRSRACNYYNC